MADRSGYIGRAPGDSSVTVARQTFSPTGVTTDFTFTSGYVVGFFDIFINGVKMIEGSDYTSTDGSTFSILNGGAVSGDVIEGVAYKAFNLGDGSKIGIQSAGTLIGNVNTLNFVGTGNTFALNGGTIDVSISGGSGGTGAGGTFAVNSTGIHTTKSVGIGTTTATGAADSNNTAILNVGIVTANSLFGALTGNVTGTVSGNAGSATVLATSRNIGGVAFNGSSDINLPGVNEAGTQNTSGTAAGLSGTPDITIRNITGVAATFTGVLTYEDVTNVDSLGIVTARGGFEIGAAGVGGTISAVGHAQFVGFTSASSFAGYDSLQAGYFDVTSGDPPDPDPVIYNVTVDTKDATHRYFGQGSSLGYRINGVFSPWLTLTPGRKYRFLMSSSDMSAHPFRFYKEADKTTAYTTDVTSTATYTEILVTDSTPQVLHYQCSLHGYMGNGASTLSNVAKATGITTAAATVAGIVTTLDLSSAQDHKITVSGISTVSVKGGTEGESHTVRIINSGITTVGFSTFFLFPSGSSPSMPTADGAISLISFTVNRVGAGGTQLLAGASLNYS